MNFFEAIQEVYHGKAITRKDWNDPSVHVKLVTTTHPLPVLSIFNGVKGGDRYHDWVISEEDMAVEWEVTAVMPTLPMAKGGIVPLDAKAGILAPHRGETLIAKPNSSPVPKKKTN